MESFCLLNATFNLIFDCENPIQKREKGKKYTRKRKHGESEKSIPKCGCTFLLKVKRKKTLMKKLCAAR